MAQPSGWLTDLEILTEMEMAMAKGIRNTLHSPPGRFAYRALSARLLTQALFGDADFPLAEHQLARLQVKLHVGHDLN